MNFEERYFTSYSDLRVHSLMLQDFPRVDSYRNAILDNPELFKDKTVLDVGAGTGILSLLCAQAGAKEVYAVEGSEDIIPVITDIVKENGYSQVIKIINAKIEDIPDIGEVPKEGQPCIPSSVDIIVSEWMGFFLIHEGMLDSVISARRFLKEDGIIFPSECTLYVALCELPQFFTDWENFHGYGFKTFAKHLRNSMQNEPQILLVDKKHIVSDPVKVFSFNIKTVTIEELQEITSTCLTISNKDGWYEGVCLWFDVRFSGGSTEVNLSTSPYAPNTHWKQTVIVFKSGSPIEEEEPVAFSLTFRKNGPRTYQICLTEEDSEKVTHPECCKCFRLKCRIIRSYLDSMASEPVSSKSSEKNN